MPAELALRYWDELAAASPHGCRIHISGGEPTGDWDALIDLCRRAQTDGLQRRAPLEKMETNAFWVDEPNRTRSRIAELDAAGMGKLVISADPYHQQFVPIERCRLAARVGEEVLGAQRVQVRWRDWLDRGFDTGSLPTDQRERLFARYAAGGRDRFNGRAAECLAPVAADAAGGPLDAFSAARCSEALLRGKHVHILPDGAVIPGTCAGIVLGDAAGESIGEIWQRLADPERTGTLVATLADRGPAGLADGLVGEDAGARIFAGRYASKCHICWNMRKLLLHQGRYKDEIGPAWLYRAACEEPAGPTAK